VFNLIDFLTFFLNYDFAISQDFFSILLLSHHIHHLNLIKRFRLSTASLPIQPTLYLLPNIQGRQFHQRFSLAFFVRNFGAKNKKLKRLALRLFGEKISAKNARIKC